MDGPSIKSEIKRRVLKTNLRDGKRLLKAQIGAGQVFRLRAKAKGEAALGFLTQRLHGQQNRDAEQAALAHRQTREGRLRVGQNAKGYVLQMKATQEEIFRDGYARTKVRTAAVTDLRVNVPNHKTQPLGLGFAQEGEVGTSIKDIIGLLPADSERQVQIAFFQPQRKRGSSPSEHGLVRLAQSLEQRAHIPYMAIFAQPLEKV